MLLFKNGVGGRVSCSQPNNFQGKHAARFKSGILACYIGVLVIYNNFAVILITFSLPGLQGREYQTRIYGVVS